MGEWENWLAGPTNVLTLRFSFQGLQHGGILPLRDGNDPSITPQFLKHTCPSSYPGMMLFCCTEWAAVLRGSASRERRPRFRVRVHGTEGPYQGRHERRRVSPGRVHGIK